jgi:hypothetical protein
MTAQEEKVLLPLIVNILNHRNKEKVFSNTKIRNLLLEFGEDKITDSQIRKFIFHIRQRNLVSLLIANGDGYFVASTVGEVREWIAMHEGKIYQMMSTLDSIKEQFESEKDLLKSGESSLVGQMSIFDYID